MTNKEEENSNYFPLIKLLPNIITLIGLCVGLSAIRFAMEGEYIKSTAFLLAAGFLDGVDGRLARFLNSTSKFGAELDSLIDFVNFGIVPSFIIYMWINEFADIKGFDWAMVLFFAICMAIRLARFNVSLNQEAKNPILEKYFFKGIPAPCGAAMAILPLIIAFEFGYDHIFTNPIFMIIYVCILAIFVGSTIPTISIKKIPIKNEYAYITLIILGSIAIGLVVTPWMTLTIIGAIYVISIPITVVSYLKIKYSKK